MKNLFGEICEMDIDPVDAAEDWGFVACPVDSNKGEITDFRNNRCCNVLYDDNFYGKAQKIIITSVHSVVFASDFMRVGKRESILVCPGQLVISAEDENGDIVTLVGSVSSVTGSENGIRETELKVTVFTPFIGDFQGVLDVSVFNEDQLQNVKLSAIYAIWRAQFVSEEAEMDRLRNVAYKTQGTDVINENVIRYDISKQDGSVYNGNGCVIHVRGGKVRVYDHSELCGVKMLRYVGTIPFLTKDSLLLDEEDRAETDDNSVIKAVSSITAKDMGTGADELVTKASLPFGSTAVFIKSKGENRTLFDGGNRLSLG